MKLSSKSILSPSHSREPPQMSLSSSFSRRLVANGSIKGGGQASPMFPTVGRKRGLGGLENPEPSSPKVTCIGQVRVKTKKQGKKMRARSKRREGEASFRKTEENFQVGVNPDLSRQKSLKSQSFQYHNHQNLQQQECLPHRNQRWVHLPLTICEALRGFGADFSCFFPCRSSCTREKEVKAEEAGGGGDGSGGGQCREGSCGDALTRSRWLVTLQEGDDVKGREIELVMAEEEEEEEDRTTDNRPERRHRRHVFEDIDIEKLKNEEFVGEEGEEEKARVSICVPPKNALLLMRCRSDPVKMAALANRFLEPSIHKQDDEDEEEQVQMEEDKVDVFVDTEAVEAKPTNPESNEEEVKAEKADEDPNAERENFSGATFLQEDGEEKVKNEEENDVIESFELSSSPAISAPSEPQNNEVSGKESTEKETTEEERPMEEEEENGSKERENGLKLERESGTLPDCLLLMMCEPKLSMEVSRETWVCTADFIRCLPARPAVKTGGGDRQTKKRVAVDSKPPLAPPQPLSIQPARSSCSFPAPVGLSEMSTTTVVGSNGYEPFVLTRCKSEPRRLPAQLGVGAAGVGF